MRKHLIVALGALIGVVSGFVLIGAMGFAVGMMSDPCSDGRPVCGNWPFRHAGLFLGAIPVSVLVLIVGAASVSASRRGTVVVLSVLAAVAPLIIVVVFGAMAHV